MSEADDARKSRLRSLINSSGADESAVGGRQEGPEAPQVGGSHQAEAALGEGGTGFEERSIGRASSPPAGVGSAQTHLGRSGERSGVRGSTPALEGRSIEDRARLRELRRRVEHELARAREKAATDLADRAEAEGTDSRRLIRATVGGDGILTGLTVASAIAQQPGLFGRSVTEAIASAHERRRRPESARSGPGTSSGNEWGDVWAFIEEWVSLRPGFTDLPTYETVEVRNSAAESLELITALADSLTEFARQRSTRSIGRSAGTVEQFGIGPDVTVEVRRDAVTALGVERLAEATASVIRELQLATRSEIVGRLNAFTLNGQVFSESLHGRFMQQS